MGILLRQGLESLQAELPADDPHLTEFLSVLFHFDHLPASTKSDPPSVAERQREKEVAKRRLAKLAEESPRIRHVLEDVVEKFNGTPDTPATFDLLHELLDGQAYRLSHWRTAMHKFN